MVVFGPVCLVPSKDVWWAAGAYTRGGFDLFVVIFMMPPPPPLSASFFHLIVVWKGSM